MMPEADGWEVCRHLRRASDVPIIILTARGDDVDKVAGLELGADDYITKPFNPRELVARVRAVLRRSTSTPAPTRVLRLADLEVDLDRREVHVGTRTLALRPKEFGLLALLASAPGVVFPRDRLLQQVWGYEYLGDSRTIDVHMTWLREKLRGSRASILTVWGVGYKLVEMDEACVG
jgi:DNA-binding response OmpR family regulator